MNLIKDLFGKTRDERFTEASVFGKIMYVGFVVAIFSWILSVLMFGSWWR